MGFFRSAKERHIAEVTEEIFYGMAAHELTSRNVSSGLFAKAIAESGGDSNLTNSLYIKLRVRALQLESAALKEYEAERIAEQAMVQNTVASNAQTKTSQQKRLAISDHDKKNHVPKRAWIILALGFFNCFLLMVIGYLSSIDTAPFFIPSFLLLVIFYYLWEKYGSRKKARPLKKWSPPSKL